VSRIVFHIDHLVLRGVRVDDMDSFSAGLGTELARVAATSSRFATRRVTALGEPHAPPRGRAVIPHAASDRRCGASVAQGIAEALGR
jgi:hypothetical protein